MVIKRHFQKKYLFHIISGNEEYSLINYDFALEINDIINKEIFEDYNEINNITKLKKIEKFPIFKINNKKNKI